MIIYNKEQIAAVINLKRDFQELLTQQKQAFIDYSQGKTLVPPPLQLDFNNPPGDCHIKAGYRVNEKLFVIKIATGFYESATTDGIILIASQKTGTIEALLYDEAYLTQIRTALAACIAAELTPFPINQIGIIGTGKQAEICIRLLSELYPSKQFSLWGRSYQKASSLANNLKKPNLSLANSRLDLIGSSQLILTITASNEPLINVNEVNPSTHIIALGADTKGKQELDPLLFQKAKTILVDSLQQTSQFGDLSYALEASFIDATTPIELGTILPKTIPVYNTNEIMITDLTGIAAQDVFLAEWVYAKLNSTKTTYSS